MSKLLIGIKSCVQDMNHSAHDVIRNTWGKDLIGADLRFFIGQTDVSSVFSHSVEKRLTTQLDLKSDEILVNAADDYDHLPWKTREILRWSVAREYDVTLLADIDTYLIPHRLMEYKFDDADYIGIMLQEIARPLTLGRTFRYVAVDRHGKSWGLPHCHVWASGGLGYFLSQKAAEYVIAREPDIWAEDLFVGQVMGEAYNQGKVTIRHADNWEGKIAFHFPHETHGRPYDPRESWMEQMYATCR